MRRALKISAWAMGAAALLALLLGGTVFIAGNTDSGRAMIERMTLRLTSGHVALSGLNGSFPQRLTLEHLQLSDYRGVWLTAEKVSVDWSPFALLGRRIRVEPRRVAALAWQANDARQRGARERIEGIVDGGEAHRRKSRTQALEQVLRGGMRLVVGELPHDGDALRRELEPRALEIAQHLLHSLTAVPHRPGNLIRMIPKCKWFLDTPSYRLDGSSSDRACTSCNLACT